MHTWIPILVKDIDDYEIYEDEIFERLQATHGADYINLEKDASLTGWLANLKNEDGTYSLKKEEIEKARKQVLDEVKNAIAEYEAGKEGWGLAMYKVRKPYSFDIATICVVDGEYFDIEMYCDFDPSDEKLTLIGYIDMHW